MLRARKQVNANVLGYVGIALAVDRGVRQRRRATLTPILDGRIGVDHLRHLIGLVADEDAVALPGRVSLFEIGERETGGGKRRIAWRGKRLVERSKASAGDVGPDHVEDSPILFVRIEPVMEKL